MAVITVVNPNKNDKAINVSINLPNRDEYIKCIASKMESLFFNKLLEQKNVY